MAAPDKAALNALLDAHLSNLKSHQAMMRQMRDYVAGIQSTQSIPHVRVAEELNQMNQRAEKILQDARRAGELMERLDIQDKSPLPSNGTHAQAKETSNIHANPSANPSGRRSKYDIELEPAGNAAKRQRISEHPNLYMPAFPPILPPFPNAMPKSFQSMRPSWHQKLFPEETKDDGSMQNRIIAANIPPDVQENDLRKHFENIGPVTLMHALRLPRLAETKIHGLSGACKARYMATLDLSDYQAANRAASQLDGTRIKSNHLEPIIVRHFCAPTTAPAAGAKRRLSNEDAGTVDPSTGSQKMPRVDVDVSQNAKSMNGAVQDPLPLSSTTAQPRKRQADPVPVVIEASNPAGPASGTNEASAPNSGKKPRLDTSPAAPTRPQQHAQPQDDQQAPTSCPDTNSIPIHPAYASSAQLALRSEFDDISNEVDRRLAEAQARRVTAHKAVAAKARAGRKRKRSSFMSAADEENDAGDRSQKPLSAEPQGTGTTATTDDADQPRNKKTKTAAHVDNKKRGVKRGGDGGAVATSAAAASTQNDAGTGAGNRVDRRQQRKGRMRKNSSSGGGGDGDSDYATAIASPASPPPAAQQQQQQQPRASKRARRTTTKADCIKF